MSLPPERVQIKRRRDEDPPDCLYLREKRIRSEYVWIRVGSDQLLPGKPALDCRPTAIEGYLSSAYDSTLSQAPTVRATQPAEEHVQGQHGRRHGVFQKFDGGVQQPHTGNRSQTDSQKLQRPMPAVHARQFYLAKNSFLTPSHVKAGHGIYKQKKKDKNDIATFVEKQSHRPAPLMSSGPSENVFHPEPSSTLPAEKPLVQEGTRPLKRPNVSVTERGWRARTWNKSSNNNDDVAQVIDTNKGAARDPPGSHIDTLALAEQLTEFTAQLDEKHAKEPPAVKKSELRFQPKSPLPRPQRPTAQQDSSDANMAVQRDSMSDDDLRHDDYIRIEATSQILPFDGLSIAVINIGEGEEETWREYFEDGEDKKEWDSEDEDENAEDYYGNDYPEDELDSADEYDREPYKYWKGASDDDVSSDEYDHRSDDEHDRNRL